MSINMLDKFGRADTSKVRDYLAEKVHEAVTGIRFGSVELTIHEGRVVQIERRERVRLERRAEDAD